ncbi:MAG: hypothetical protein MMC23_002065 [Stictis urceolatum]|nr:hypothetical protein [Stictis urceolata]
MPSLLRLITPSAIDDDSVAAVWARELDAFVLAMSDQQLITSLILLGCAYASYWHSSVKKGANNLWVAADIVCFSSVTHAATLLTLREYFRRHRYLASARVALMYAIYIMWLVIAIHILDPHKPGNSTKLPTPAARFRHAATFIKVFSVLWIYLFTYLPIFLSAEAIRVREGTAESRTSTSHIDHYAHRVAWVGSISLRRKSSASQKRSILTYLHVYKHFRSQITRFVLWFNGYFYRQRDGWYRTLLWAGGEVIFPWRSTGLCIAFVWMFGLAVMIVNVVQENLSHA